MVRQKAYTEDEQITILNAVLANKELLEDSSATNVSREGAKKDKWNEIAATIDSYFGTSRGATKIRALYRQWKRAATRKYNSKRVKKLTAKNFGTTLSEPERILRQICPDIFPRFDFEGTTSTERDTGEANYRDKKAKLQPPANSKNRNEDSSNDFEIPEEKKVEAEAFGKPSDVKKMSYHFEVTMEKAENSNLQLLDPVSIELELLTLSLEPMIDTASTIIPTEAAALENVSNEDMENVGDIALIEAIVDDEELIQEISKFDADKETSDFKNGDAGSLADRVMAVKIERLDASSRVQLMAQNTVFARKGKSAGCEEMKKGESSGSAIDIVNPSDENEIDGKNMEIEVNVRISDEAAGNENRYNCNEPSEAPRNFVQTRQAAAQNIDDGDETLPDLPVIKVDGKRKKASKAKNAKKRKTAKGASVRV